MNNLPDIQPDQNTEASALAAEVTRRDFVRTSSSFAAAMTMLGGVPLIAQPQEKKEDAPAGSTVKCAVIGCNVWGREILNMLARFPKAEVIAVCDHYPAALRRAKEAAPEMLTKSGFMVGLGETQDELFQLMRDLRDHRCDIVTIGQYLRPSKDHLPIDRYYDPSEYQAFRDYGRELGFHHVEAGPLVRSSYHARDVGDAPLREVSRG